MKNCLILNGKEIELSAEQVKEIEKAIGKKSDTKLKDVPVGEVFKIADYEFIVLEHSKDTTAVILKGLLHDRVQFGSNNNFNDSNVDVKCTEFASKIEKIIGKRNLIEHTVDLTSDDGLKDYGKVKRYVSLLTTDRYRRYVEILDMYKIGQWWWLATPYSTPTHENDSWVKCVSPSCFIYYFSYFNYGGVRPFCVMNSNIIVSHYEAVREI